MFRKVGFAMITSLLVVGLGVESGVLAFPMRLRVTVSLAGFWVAIPGARCGQHEGPGSALLSLL